MTERKTPLLDELDSGPWPSFVKEIKKSRKNPIAEDLLGILERSYEEKIGHWKHGGIVGVMGYGGGVIGRYTDLPEDFPNVAHFHTMRIPVDQEKISILAIFQTISKIIYMIFWQGLECNFTE